MTHLDNLSAVRQSRASYLVSGEPRSRLKPRTGGGTGIEIKRFRAQIKHLLHLFRFESWPPKLSSADSLVNGPRLCEAIQDTSEKRRGDDKSEGELVSLPRYSVSLTSF